MSSPKVKKPHPFSAKLRAAVAGSATAPAGSDHVPPATPEPPSAPPAQPLPPSPASAQPQAPQPAAVPPVAGKVPKKTKTYSLNVAEISKVEDAFDYLRAHGIRDASKAAIIRAWIRLAPVDEAFAAEVSKDKQD